MTTYRFNGFELDEGRRILKGPGGPAALQPRVFDLLVFLVRNRDRVVSKEELVEAVWQGAFVTDGAIQRAMSVLRSELRKGPGEVEIKTHPRQGYRFCGELAEAAGAATEPEERLALEEAREAIARQDWATALDRFRIADRGDGLIGRDLESWGTAAEHVGDLDAAMVPLERAVAAFSASACPCDAGRAALRLANVQLERREIAVARGWYGRARRYLSGTEPCHEVAMLEWLEARFLLFSGEMDEALAQAETAYDIARELGDRDVEALALLYRGLSMLALGKVRPGIELLDESAAAVLGEGLDPWTGGIVYCGVIWSCLNRGDWRRAAEWTDQFTRWCSTNGVCGYPGLCRLHRAEILSLRGAVEEAEKEAAAAAGVLASAIPFAEGDAHRVLGEIRLSRGDFEGAESAFRRTHELGWDPNPGYALLQLEQGRAEAAMRSLEGALVAKEWSVRQRRGFLLAHLAIAAVEAGAIGRAGEALDELDDHPELWETDAVGAVVSQARGRLALAEGRPTEAAMHLRTALSTWRELGSPCRMAAVRLMLASALDAAGDFEGARLEIDAAEATYRESSFEPLLDRCTRTRQELRLGAAPGGAASA